MKTVVDTSGLVALLYPGNEHNRRAAMLLRDAYANGALVIGPIVYVELAADRFFEDTDALNGFLADTGIDVEEPSREASFGAGKAFQRYLDRRGEKLQCSVCGTEAIFECPDRGTLITARQHVPADFVIGAQAEHDADGLLTFDQGFYRDYFDVDVQAVREE